MSTAMKRQPTMHRQTTSLGASDRLQQLLDELPKNRYLKQSDEEMIREEVVKLEREVKVMRRRMKQHQLALNAVKGQEDDLKSEMGSLSGDILTLRELLSEKDAAMAAKERKIQQQKQKIQHLEAQLQQQQDALHELRHQLDESADIRVLFASHLEEEGSSKRTLESIRYVIDQSKSQVCVACFSVDSLPIAEALGHAAARGVDVRVLHDYAWAQSMTSSTANAAKAMNWSRITKRWKSKGVSWAAQHGEIISESRVNPRFANFSHNFLIIDEMVLMCGTYPILSQDDATFAADSTLIQVTASLPACNPAIMDAIDFFQQLWNSRIRKEAHRASLTTIKLPNLT